MHGSYIYSCELELNCFTESHVSEINVTSVLAVTFVPDVSLHLTKSSVIKEIFTEVIKNVKDDDGIVTVSTTTRKT